MEFVKGEKLKINAEATYLRDSTIYPDSIVVKLDGPDVAEAVIPVSSVERFIPNIGPGLVIKIASGYLALDVAMRTSSMWHFSQDEDSCWSDEEVVSLMHEWGYVVIYNPSEEE